MPRLMIHCPETGRPIYTHVNFNWNSFDWAEIGERRVECPICRTEHLWRRADAYLEEEGGGA